MKKYITPIVLSFSLFLNLVALPQVAVAQTCSSSDYVQRGALKGTIALTNQDEDTLYDVAYLSDETWNEENPTETTTLNFGTNYTENTGLTGQAWSEVFGWIDFDHGSIDQAIFQTVADNSEEWGGWSGEVNGLSDVGYGTNNAKFIGKVNTYSEAGVYIGLVMNFDANDTIISFEDDSQCSEYVDVFINNTNNFYQASCPIATPTIKWNTKNIESGTCVTSSGSLWGTTGSKSDTNISGESAAGPVTESGTYQSPQKIKLTCTGLSGNPVNGVATIRCGETPCDPSDPACVTDPGEITPIFKEV